MVYPRENDKYNGKVFVGGYWRPCPNNACYFDQRYTYSYHCNQGVTIRRFEQRQRSVWHLKSEDIIYYDDDSAKTFHSLSPEVKTSFARVARGWLKNDSNNPDWGQC